MSTSQGVSPSLSMLTHGSIRPGDRVEELPGKVRGQLRNVRKVEAEIAALKISSLKRINKGSRLIIIDS